MTEYSDHDIIVTMAQQVEDIHRRISKVPEECATHSAEIENLKGNVDDLWSVVGKKASWAAVVGIGTLIIALITALVMFHGPS